MNDTLENQKKDARYLKLVAGGWVPTSDLSKNHQHLVSSDQHHLPNMEHALATT